MGKKSRLPVYRELAAELLGDRCQVFALGDKEDRRLYESRPWPDGVVDLAGRLTLLETAGAMRQREAAADARGRSPA
jgi:hypothetical protein